MCSEALRISCGGSGKASRTEEQAITHAQQGFAVSAVAALPILRASGYPGQRATEGVDKCRRATIAAGTAFYRKYTEQLLRRYMRTSMEMGRSPSVLGNLVFRGKASYSGIRNFEDAVIFVHDVESCLKKLNGEGRELVARIALQEYTQSEVADMQGASVRTVMRRYAETLDRLTVILLEVKLLKVPRF
jgi:hypothetical protein